ncbi:MAG: fatty acid desaturase [Polyangiaceae bacterium]|jgi:fatty acid desaturase|nr:fatty acid desaturase [Polyangiaceae bacterium]
MNKLSASHPVDASTGSPVAHDFLGTAVSEADRLWFIDGKAYDLSEFLEKHPGGLDAIRLGQGTDCTELFRTYHFRRMPAAKLLARYEVSVNRNDPQVLERLRGSDFTFKEGEFYRTIHTRALKYFADTKKTPGATRWDQVFAVSLLVGVLVLMVPAYVQGSLAAAALLGFVRALAAVNPGHCMSHFSVFPRGRWNSLVFRVASPFLVSTWSIWTSTHVKSHHVHTLTTEDGQDNYPLKRVVPETEYRPWHGFQHQYIWLVYLLGLPLWSLQDMVVSLRSLVTGSPGPTGLSPMEHLNNTLQLAFNLLVSVVMPFLFLPVGQAAAVCLITNSICSLMVILQIVVNHEVPETLGATSRATRGDWGAHQVLTSHNYSVDSALALHLSGGLNMQIEHHLFPSVHYRHYPALGVIVREACAEFGLPYNTSPTFAEAVRKHYRLLEMNSTRPEVVQSEA